MKFACASLLLLVAVIGANASVDWSSLKSMDIEVTVPMIHRGIPDGRITKGQIAGRNQFTYQVGLLLYMNGGAAWCGGSLISDRWVLTAAHCTEAVTTGVDVLLGAFNRADESEKGQQKVFVERDGIIIHPGWDSTQLLNDISLIKLPVPIEFDEHIQPIALPVKSKQYATYAGETGTASGWGKTSDSATGVTDKLQFIKVPIMNNSGCSPWYGGVVKDTNICIKTTGGTSTCNGDSGGPLVVYENVKPVLVGATSFGIAFGCEVGWPGVFTRITPFLDWIAEETGVVNNGF